MVEKLAHLANILSCDIKDGKFGLVTNFHVYDASKAAANEEATIFKAAIENENKVGPRRTWFGKKKADKKVQLALGYQELV